MADQDWFSQNAPKAAAAPAASGGDWFAQNGPQTPAAPAQPQGGVAHMAEEFWKRANPMGWIDGLVETAKHPVESAGNMIKADPKFLTESKEAAGKGDYLTAGRKLLSFLAMGMGHDLDTQADMGAKGDYSGMTGAMAGTATQFLAPEAAAKVVAAVPTAVRMQSSNPAIQEAVAFGQRAGVPMDAATATDNAAVRAAQHLSDKSLGGAQVAGKALQRQSQGLATLGEQLAAKAHPSPVTPELAGQGVREAVLGNVKQAAGAADTAYGTLRQIEAKTPMPVDLTTTKAALKPMFDGLLRERELNGVMMGDKARALNALDKIMSGPDAAPLSTVDAALSDLKSFARSDVPELRSVGQGAAAQVVKQLDGQVRSAAAQAGPHALKALEEGRAATTAKYVAADVLDTIDRMGGASGESVKVTAGLTARADTALNKLRDVAKQAPAEMPKIGRSVLDGLLEKAADGATPFAHADKIYADWNKLGRETKNLLFKDPAYIRDLDNFFLLSKQMAKNANPSGTAHAVAMIAQGSQVWNPVHFAATVAGTAGLSGFLHSAAGVRLLSEGLRLPASPAARAAWQARLTKFGTTNGLVQGAQPATAGQ